MCTIVIKIMSQKHNGPKNMNFLLLFDSVVKYELVFSLPDFSIYSFTTWSKNADQTEQCISTSSVIALKRFQSLKALEHAVEVAFYICRSFPAYLFVALNNFKQSQQFFPETFRNASAHQSSGTVSLPVTHTKRGDGF